MSVSEKDFNAILRKIIRQVLIEQEKISSEQQLLSLKEEKKVYIAVNEEWDNRYYLFFEELKKLNKNVKILILGDKVDEFRTKAQELKLGYDILKVKDFKVESDNEMVVFPVISRNDIIDIASCTDKTATTKVVRRCFEEGAKIYFMKFGIEKLTGKEPEKYKQRILAYYREILEFNIEMIDDIRAVM